MIVDTNFAISLQRHYFEKKDYKTYSGKGHRVRNSFVLGKTKNKPDFSILLVIFESMRKDRMQCYGYRRESTPNLQEFIQRHQKEFFVFEKPYTVSTTTMLAVPAILTGIGPHENTDKLYSQPIVWDYARKQNYHRFFMSSHTMQWYRFYKFYQNEQLNHFWTKDQSSYPFFNDLGIDDHHTIDHLTKHLGQLNNKPFFGVVQLNGTHYPYKVKKEFEKWNDNFSDGYDNAVLYQDDAMKELFDYLKQSKKEKNTLIIFVSDHAESLKEHNNIGHVDSYYQEAISIPLMLYIPKALQKKYPIATLKENIRTNVANTDIAPTIIDLLQLKQDKEIKSLYSNFSGFSLLRKVPKNRPIIIMNNNEIARFRVGVSLVKGKYHYLWRTNIVPNKEEIYNLEQDPKELSNLFPQWSTKQIYNLKKVLKQEKNCLPYLKHHDAF